MKCWITDSTRRFFEQELKESWCLGAPEGYLVKVYPDIGRQKIIGFGAALTEASGYVYAQMDDQVKREFLKLFFGEGSIAYGFCRLVVQSSDFGLGPRMYVDSKRGMKHDEFSIEADRLYELPLIKDALRENPGLEFLASPWSPPAWAKTNKSMKRGGRLLRKHYGSWAQIIARYVFDYRQEGVRITHLTVQNEPQAVQKWESCLFTAAQEREFASAHLRPALDALGLEDVRILIWDHNKEGLVDRVAGAVHAEKHERDAIDGAAFHWYSGDHFEAVRASREMLGDDRDLVFTEGCCAYSAGDTGSELSHAEHYAREIMGDLEAGANAILDWNIVLDSDGGPNHVGNYCDAAVMYDGESGKLNVRLPYYYLGHFSRFIKPGARRVLSTCYTVQLETAAFENPDGSHVLVVLNRNPWPIEMHIQADYARRRLAKTSAPPHSIMTVTW